MRDIKSNKRQSDSSPEPQDLPPEVKELYRKMLPKKPRFTGAKVGVTNIDVPKISQNAGRSRAIAPAPLPKTTARRPASQSRPASGQPKGSLSLRDRKIAFILLGLVLAAVILAAVIFLPKAQIAMVLETAPLLVDQKLSLQSQPSEGENVVPAETFAREVRIEGVAPVTSTAVVGSKAAGTVVLVNRTTEEQPIRENSRLVTSDNHLFYMQKFAILPPAEGGAPSETAVAIEAAEPGSEGNISSGRLNFAALDPSSQSVVYGEVRQPLSGGSGEEVKIIKDSDLAQARAAAGLAARQKVEEEIRNQLKDGWQILEESWQTEFSEFSSDGEKDKQAETINYSGQVLVRVMSYEDASLTNYLEAALEARLDENYMLFPGPISFTKSVDSIDWEKPAAEMTVRVTHTTVPDFSLQTLRDKLAGRSQSEAVNYLNGLKGVKSVSVDLSPFWVKKIPRIDSRINIDFRSDRP